MGPCRKSTKKNAQTALARRHSVAAALRQQTGATVSRRSSLRFGTNAPLAASTEPPRVLQILGSWPQSTTALRWTSQTCAPWECDRSRLTAHAAIRGSQQSTNLPTHYTCPTSDIGADALSVEAGRACRDRTGGNITLQVPARFKMVLRLFGSGPSRDRGPLGRLYVPTDRVPFCLSNCLSQRFFQRAKQINHLSHFNVRHAPSSPADDEQTQSARISSLTDHNA